MRAPGSEIRQCGGSAAGHGTDREDLISRALAAGLGAEEVKLWEQGAARRDCAEASLVSKLRIWQMQHAEIQARVFAALLAGAMLFNLHVDAAVLLMWADDSLIYRVAATTAMGPDAVAHVLLGLGSLLLPFIALQFGVLKRRRRGVTQLACASLAITGVVWMFLAWRCSLLDLGAAQAVFWRSGGGSILFAMALAWSLNAEQLRLLLERTA